MIGRLASLKTTYQKGTVTNTLLYTATEMVTVNVSAANQTEDKLTHSVSLSGNSDITLLSALSNAGTGYASGTKIGLTGGTGSNATVDIAESGGVINSVVINEGGSGYSLGDVLTIDNANADGVRQVSVANTGGSIPTGITSDVVTTALTGTGSGLTVDITGENGNVIAVAIKTDGSGYAQNDTIQLSGIGDGSAEMNVDFIHGNSATLTVADGNFNKDSDFIAYGIPLEVGGNAMYDDITLKAGDSVWVSSSEPGVSFTVISNTSYGNVNTDVQKNLGRANSYISSTAFPQINDNVGLVTAKYDGVATIHVSNRNSDKVSAVSVGIASGDISTFKHDDFFLFGQRLQPLQELTIDNIGIASGQTLVTRASKTDVAFAAYTRPIELQFAGVGTDGSVNTIGVITATKFVGDGSQITGVIAAGSGVSITSDGSQVGVAATIDFGSEFNITSVSAGIATITAGTVPNASVAVYAATAGVATVAQEANALAVGVAVTLASNALSANACTGNAASADIASGLTTNFDIVSYNPIRTYDKFYGDGSQLTNITAQGTGIVVRHDGASVGTASSIDFTTSFDVTTTSAGITTISVQKVPHADICGVSSYSAKCGVATYATNAGIASQATNATFAQTSSFSTLTGAAETSKSLYTEHKGGFLPLPVTRGTKTTNHRYYGIGSDRSINIQGYESPYLRFEVGQTYRFENAAQQANYPLRFYTSASGDPVGYGSTTPGHMTQDVTETGTYTEITVTEYTPSLFWYGMGVGATMGSMGNSIQVFNSEMNRVLKVGEYKNTAGLKTCTHTQMFEGRATAWYMNTNLGVGNSDYTPGDRSHNVSSIEQSSTGVYTVNFADEMNDNNYAVVVNGRGTNNFPGGLVDATVFNRTTTGFGVTIYNGIPAPEDLRDVNIVVYGGQDGEPAFL